MKKMIQVDAGLYRGPRPKSVRELLEKGITRSASFQSGFFEMTHNDQYERELAVVDTVIEKRFDCSDIWPPSRRDMDDALAKVDEWMEQGLKVLVHCASGVDRTGFFFVIYRIVKCGWPFKKAVEEMILLGQHPWYRWWIVVLWWRYGRKKAEVAK